MEAGAGPHPLRQFICLMPLSLALLLGPGRPGTAEEGEETGGCSWSLRCQKTGDCKAGVLARESYGETGVYWGLKQAGEGSKELERQRKRWLSNREERGVEELGVCRPGRLGKKDTRNRGSQRRWSRAGETDRLSNWRWEVWGRGEESRREGDAEVR